MRRIERLINLIAALLETRRPLTAEEIRERIAGYDQSGHEAFRRAFERDKDALRSMGIPLETRAMSAYGDDPDGYIIPKTKYYLPELDLAPDELTALRLAAAALIGAGQEAESGFLKLSVDAAAEIWTAPKVTWGADLNAEQPLLGPLYSAVSERSVLAFDYKTSDGEARTRTIEPYGLVHRRGNWYVIGRDHDRDDIRAFRASRIQGGVRTVPGSFEVPAGFDVEAHLSAEAWEIGDRTQTKAVVRFSPSLRWWAEQNLDMTVTSEGADGSLDVELEANNLDALISWVIGFAGEAEIVSPPDARAGLVDRVESAAGGAGG